MQNKTPFDSFFNQIYHYCVLRAPYQKKQTPSLVSEKCEGNFESKGLTTMISQDPRTSPILGYSQVKTYFFFNHSFKWEIVVNILWETTS